MTVARQHTNCSWNNFGTEQFKTVSRTEQFLIFETIPGTEHNSLNCSWNKKTLATAYGEKYGILFFNALKI
jgi:hypothetical protein